MFTIQSYMSNFCQPAIMGILNVTPDSFAVHCADLDSGTIMKACSQLQDQGATIIDIGACSTQPGVHPVDTQEEWRRLEIALAVIRKWFPQQILSVDTFRAEIAQRAISEYHIDMVNDISGLQDPEMINVLARTRVPYVLTHPRVACEGWNSTTDVASELLSFFSFRLDRLHQAGVVDIMIDPGLGFGKTIEQNYAILRHLPLLKQLEAPILVGASRKSMIYKVLETDPESALTGTVAVNTLALINGASILRVHDVREAQQTISIYQHYLNC